MEMMSKPNFKRLMKQEFDPCDKLDCKYYPYDTRGNKIVYEGPLSFNDGEVWLDDDHDVTTCVNCINFIGFNNYVPNLIKVKKQVLKFFTQDKGMNIGV